MNDAIATTPPPIGLVRPGLRERLRRGDEPTWFFTFAFALLVLLLTAAFFWELYSGAPLIWERFSWRFLVNSNWDPVAGEFGAAPFIYGTLVTSFLALALAVPLGIGVALFLSELAPRRLSEATALLVDLLAAVPSVIYGLIGVTVLVPLMRTRIEPLLATTGLPLFSGPAYGVGYLTAAFILTFMIVPFIVSVSREVLLAVPRDQREAALALGSTRWETTWHVILPHARLGIIGAVFLALGRALGETMAVTMVIGNRPEIATSLLAPGYSMAAVIANEFTEATSDLHLQALVAIGFVLFVMTMIINAVARGLILATTGMERRR